MNKKYLFFLIAACLTLTLGCARIEQKTSINRIKSLTPGYALLEVHKQYIPEPKKYLKGLVGKIAVICPEKNTYNQLVYKELQGFLWEIPSLQLIERRNLEAILREHKLQLSGLITEKDCIKIGNLLGATHILYFDNDIIESEGLGSLSVSVSIPIYIYNVATGETEYYFNSRCLGQWSVNSANGEILEFFKKMFRDNKAFRDDFFISLLNTACYHAELSLSKAFQYEYDPLGIIYSSTPDNIGVKIMYVAANSPAEEAGLDTVKKIDFSSPERFFTSVDMLSPIWLEIDDMEILNYAQIEKYLKKKKVGDTVRLKIKQSGEIKTVNIKLKYFW